MSEDVRTKLQALSSGQSMRKRQSPKRIKSKTKEQVQTKEQSLQNYSTLESIKEEDDTKELKETIDNKFLIHVTKYWGENGRIKRDFEIKNLPEWIVSEYVFLSGFDV